MFKNRNRIIAVLGVFLIMGAYQNCSGGKFESIKVTELTSTGSPNGFNVGSSNRKYQCSNPSLRGTTDNKMRRLTKPEITNTLASLLGNVVMNDSSIQTQLNLLINDKMISSVLDIAENPPDTQAKALLNIAERATDLILADPVKLKAIFGDCATVSISDECMRSFINNFGLKIMRRPLAAPESQAYMSNFQSAGKGSQGMAMVLIRMLMSPSLTYHLEYGEGQLNGRTRLTDYEVASRLAYRLTGTLPDNELFEAAKNGTLKNLENVKTQAKRLLRAYGKDKVSDFFRYYMKQDSIAKPNLFAVKAAKLAADDSQLRQEMVTELNDFINHVVWNKSGGVKMLFSSNEVFPKTATMAKILETPISSNNIPTKTTADHVGLLFRPAALSAPSGLTSPFHRAIWVRSNVLCETIPAPDLKQVEERQAELGDLSQLGNRERLTRQTSAPACIGCHSFLNPIGFSLESYDQLGMKRSIESVFDSNGNVIRTHPIDPVVDNAMLEGGNGRVNRLESAIELQNAIANGPTARNCFLKQVFEYQRARDIESADSCALSELEELAEKDASVQDIFIQSVANEDIFYKAGG